MIVDGLRPGSSAPGGAPSPATILLACLRAPDTVRGLCAHPEIDWPRVVAEAGLHRVVSLTLEALQRSGAVAAGHVPTAVLAELKRQRRHQVGLTVRLDAALAEILATLATRGVPVIVLKGVTLARLYPALASRPRSDLDLLIDPADWPRAENTLVRMGYQLLEAAHVRRPLLSPRQSPEDRQYYRARDGLLVELHADYLGSGLRRPADRAVWRRARTAGIAGLAVPIPMLSPGDTFLHVTTHLQRHAYTRLLWFYDLWLLLRAEGALIPWDEVARQAERAGVKAAAYYGISYAEALFGPIAPPRARAALRPGVLRRRLHEGMWPRRRILSLDVDLIPALETLQQAHQLPPAVFDAYDPPGRMLVHLLLSGDVWPKALILARRFLPAEEWLRHYGPAQVRRYRARLLLARLLARLAA